ncbi:MAG: hypothetical protein GF383_06750 [Candidatus Lokiarchaeota archaeon]|nr:hypothetical protein [Candidatus Lokiarchaeota archaeon]MBD3339816.1 hypothetical protein [Candidatus Lokiarchaeota archaeon]
MSAKFTGFPALMYSGLYILKEIGILKKDYSDTEVKILLLITDAPPAFLICIDKGDFYIEILNEIMNLEDVKNAESLCDYYLATPSNILLAGADKIFQGISQNSVKINDNKVLIYLGTIASVF